jgi:signal transduction histidine kinase
MARAFESWRRGASLEMAFDFSSLVAFQSIVYTFGGLVHLFLMVLIVGQRRLRRFEWLLFALMAALFMWNSGNLLAINVGLNFGMGANILSGASRLIPFLGLVLTPPLLVHVQEEYAAQFRPQAFPIRLLKVIFYLPLAGLPWMVGMLLGQLEVDPVFAIRPLLRPIVAWMMGALLVSSGFSLDAARRVARGPLKRFHIVLAGLQTILIAGLVWAYFLHPLPLSGLGGTFPTVLMLVAVLASIWVGYSILRYQFLDLRVQRNLVYSLLVIFALLIYLDGIRRLGSILEDHDIFPAVATESVMIFILVVMLEPVKRRINRVLHSAFVSEFERVQKLSDEIQHYAMRSGDMGALKKFVEERVCAELSVEKVELEQASAHFPSVPGDQLSRMRVFPIRRGTNVIGYLAVTPVTSDLSGDQFGALQMLADQLAAALELCQLIADKVHLERELAEKAKMAFLGEMAARIAHNVKNPLSSMKTVIQLLEEDASLPERVRRDCTLVAGEIDRLNANISQVLRYAKPARDTDRPADLSAVVARVISMMRPEAERRQVRLDFDLQPTACPVKGGEEAASDIVSNLVVNALESTSPGGLVRVQISPGSDLAASADLIVEDNGKGISTELREKIFQPFFTTRPGGTGLGLAIVSRRAEEIGGAVECASPINGGAGARFVVRFQAARGENAEPHGRREIKSTT